MVGAFQASQPTTVIPDGKQLLYTSYSPYADELMPAADTNRFLREFHAKLRDRPLSPDDPFYVPYLSGPGDPIAHLAQQIEWRDAAGVYLLSGHPGC